MIALLCAPAFAEEPECQYEGSVRQMNACAIENYQATYKRYTDVFQNRWRKILPEHRKNAEAEARSWASTVRKQCIRASAGTGSDETVLFYTCLQQVMEVRILQLRS